MFVLPDLRGRRVNGPDRGFACLSDIDVIRISPLLAFRVRPEINLPSVIPFASEVAGERICQKISLELRFSSGAGVSLRLGKRRVN
jgi:hypothetical protein